MAAFPQLVIDMMVAIILNGQGIATPIGIFLFGIVIITDMAEVLNMALQCLKTVGQAILATITIQDDNQSQVMVPQLLLQQAGLVATADAVKDLMESTPMAQRAGLLHHPLATAALVATAVCGGKMVLAEPED